MSALLSRTSRRPISYWTCAAAAEIEVGNVTSRVRVEIVPFGLKQRIELDTEEALEGKRQAIITWKVGDEQTRTLVVARPMPELAPGEMGLVTGLLEVLDGLWMYVYQGSVCTCGEDDRLSHG
jgi:hypothetical protein